jgi:hypothetical protein
VKSKNEALEWTQFEQGRKLWGNGETNAFLACCSALSGQNAEHNFSSQGVAVGYLVLAFQAGERIADYVPFDRVQAETNSILN